MVLLVHIEKWKKHITNIVTVSLKKLAEKQVKNIIESPLKLEKRCNIELSI